MIKLTLLAALLLIAVATAATAAPDSAAKKPGAPSAAAASNGNNKNSNGNNKGAAAGSPSASKNKRFASWAPSWLPNIHTMSALACKSISEFREHSPVVQTLVEFSNSSARDGAVSTDSVSNKMRRAVSSVKSADSGAAASSPATATATLSKAVGYNYAKLNGYGYSGSATSSRVHATPDAPPRLLCLGFSHIDSGNKEETALGQMYTAWAKQCDRTLLYTRKKTIPGVPAEATREIHPIMGDSQNNIWQKIRLALSMLADPTQDGRILQESDYVVFFTDDTFFSVPNAKAMLMEPYYVAATRANALLLLGHRMNDNANIFVSNLGYILNRQMARVLADLVNTPACDPMAVTGSDDIQLGRCVGAYGVFPMDTYDEVGEDRMLMWEPEMLAYSVQHGFPEWYVRYRARPVLKTLRIGGMHPVAFHGVNNAEKIQRLEKLVG